MCPDASGWTALHTAAYHGGSEILALLIEKGVDVDSGGGLHDGTGITALHRACCHDQNDAVLQLISARADPCRRDNRGWTGIHHAAAVGISPNRAVATLLSNHDVDISTVDREGSQALHIAASAGHTDFCRYDTIHSRVSCASAYVCLCPTGSSSNSTVLISLRLTRMVVLYCTWPFCVAAVPSWRCCALWPTTLKLS